MNERILKLAKESGISLRGYPMNPLMVYPDELAKFAQLIVGECVEQIEKWTPSKFENDFEEGAVWAFEESVIRIKEHFSIDNESLPYTVTRGVEE